MLTENREFNEIYEQYKNLILKAAYTYSGSYSAAEDITQDTFLKLYMGYDSMKKKYFSSSCCHIPYTVSEKCLE